MHPATLEPKDATAHPWGFVSDIYLVVVGGLDLDLNRSPGSCGPMGNHPPNHQTTKPTQSKPLVLVEIKWERNHQTTKSPNHRAPKKADLGPAVERLDYGYFFSVVYFSRKKVPTKKGVQKGT